MKIVIDKTLKEQSVVACEFFVLTVQRFESKSLTKKLKDGTLVNHSLEDLAPFLPREELLKNMYIKPMEDDI
ncbi:MAG: hypothetical protein P1P64_07655 [Treponemataceae bacterium]